MDETTRACMEAVPCFDQRSRAWLRAPRPWDRLAYINRVLPARIERGARELNLEPGSSVLDFGCADTHYREIFPPEVHYVGADIPGNQAAEVHVSADGRLPLPDGSVDGVLSTQVLEHVADPHVYLSECYRVLRPGGRMLLSTHGIMVLHPDPIDFWRWTSDGLRHELGRAGFTVRSFAGIMGLAATGLQLFQDATWGNLPPMLRSPYAYLLQSMIALCERFQSERSRSFNALVFMAIAEKPPGPPLGLE